MPMSLTWETQERSAKSTMQKTLKCAHITSCCLIMQWKELAMNTPQVPSAVSWDQRALLEPESGQQEGDDMADIRGALPEELLGRRIFS